MNATPFGGMIGPGNLLTLVENTARFLFEERETGVGGEVTGSGAEGWRDLLRAGRGIRASPEPTAGEWEAYFGLCLACHHATVATFVPTDVDSKIRGLLWRGRDPESVRRMRAMAERTWEWTVRPVSARVVDAGVHGDLSGHDGERLSVLAGALGALLATGDTAGAEEVAERIDRELDREAQALGALVAEPGAELSVLALASVMTHNAGDLDQGISFWNRTGAWVTYRERFGELAHERPRRHGGAFHLAAHLYRHTLAPEGHRNYPLRKVPPLRRARDLLLPIAPFLDGWGETVATHPALREEDRALVLGALIRGCLKIEGQLGYHRAIAGFLRRLSGPLDRVARHLHSTDRHGLKDVGIRKQTGVPRGSFESGYRKRAVALLREWRRP